MKPRTQAIVRVVVLAIGGLVTTLAVAYFLFLCVMVGKLRGWVNARPLDIVVDVSRIGEFSGQFTPKCPIAFCYQLLLVLPPALADRPESEDLLAGMEAHLSVVDSRGSALRELEERPVQPAQRRPGRPIALERIFRLPSGTYTLRLTISKGAKPLSGTQQRLMLKYVCSDIFVLVLLKHFFLAMLVLAVGAILFSVGVRLRVT
jgi:hypothetical protein